MTTATTSTTSTGPSPAAEVGAEIGPFVRETGFDNWNRYAAVNDEFVPIHMDDEAGRAAGMPAAFGMGNLQWSYLHNLVRDWVGEHGRIVRMACEFRTPNLKGTVTARGRVARVEPGEDGATLVHLEVWTENAAGRPMAPGTAVVELAAG
ncbi:hypothetical protein [Nocardioides sp. YIM 152588]|uniref:hypothetical protein n=1 Tax=Nocardioides sp. YIM 152588 TaxID=3158259 RepID=UPI0032E4B9F9